MYRVAVIYRTKYGQTKKVAQAIQNELADSGLDVDLLEIEHGSNFDLGVYSGLIVGGPIYAGKLQRRVVKWIRKNAAHLNEVHSALFTVGMNAADKRPQARIADLQIVTDTLNATGLHPDFTGIFAGALAYPRYNWFIRFILQKISGSASGPTDTSQEYELTNWADVKEFAHAFSHMDRSSKWSMANLHRTMAPPPPLPGGVRPRPVGHH